MRTALKFRYPGRTTFSYISYKPWRTVRNKKMNQPERSPLLAGPPLALMLALGRGRWAVYQNRIMIRHGSFLHTNTGWLARPAGSTQSILDYQSMCERYLKQSEHTRALLARAKEHSRSQRRRYFWSLAVIKRIAASEDENGKEVRTFFVT